MRRLLATVSIGFLLLACGKEPQIAPLPEGMQMVEGILFPAELSVVRRGTHVVQQDGEPVYYLESKTVNLRSLEHQQVRLSGVLEYNTDPADLPVMVVEEAVSLQAPAERFVSRSLGLSFELPQQWSEVTIDDGVQFTASGSLKPILTVLREHPDVAIIPDGGVPIYINSYKAVRFVDEETGGETVSIESSEALLLLLFTPRDHPQAALLKAQWLSLLQTIKLSNDPLPLPSTPTGTGSVIPCGGPAGILCPQGYFCSINDLEENIGTCKKLRTE